MSIKYGFIPEEITYVVKNRPENFKIYWDDFDAAIIDRENLYNAFPTGTPANLITAKKWASPQAGNCYSYKKPILEPIIFTLKNKDLFNIQILGLVKRSEGGRAYKVLIPSENLEGQDLNLIVDLREDILTDILISYSVINGVIQAPMRFAIIGSALQLVVFDSALWKFLEKQTEKKEQKKLSKKDLKFGYIYSDRAGDKFIYFGEYNNYDAKCISSNPVRRNYSTLYINTYKAISSKTQVWFTYTDYMQKELSNFKTLESFLEKNYFYFNAIKDKKILDEISDSNFDLREEDFVSLFKRIHKSRHAEYESYYFALQTLNSLSDLTDFRFEESSLSSVLK